MRHSTKTIAGALLLLAAITVGLMFLSDPGTTVFGIATGVLASLIASLFVLVLNSFILEAPAERALEAVGSLGRELDRLSAATILLSHAHAYEIYDVRPKLQYTKAEWRNVLDTASNELTLVGHALDSWCAQEVQPAFHAAIARVTAKNGIVRLLTLSKSSSRVSDQRKLPYRDRIETTLRAVEAICADLPERQRDRLRVFHLDAAVEMPYMAVSTDRILMASLYPAAVQDSDRVPVVKVAASSEIADLIRTDLDLMFERHATRVV